MAAAAIIGLPGSATAAFVPVAAEPVPQGLEGTVTAAARRQALNVLYSWADVGVRR